MLETLPHIHIFCGQPFLDKKQFKMKLCINRNFYTKMYNKFNDLSDFIFLINTELEALINLITAHTTKNPIYINIFYIFIYTHS